MKYPDMKYVQINALLHELRSYDGTCRSVVFESEEAASRALLPGRAGLDVVAVGSGFLPRGATLVSRAEAGDIETIMAETTTGTTDKGPLAKVRIGFSVHLKVERSERISSEEDVSARKRRPEDARRYEALVDEVERFEADRGRA